MEILLMNSMDKKKRVGFGFDLKIWVGFEKHPNIYTNKYSDKSAVEITPIKPKTDAKSANLFDEPEKK